MKILKSVLLFILVSLTLSIWFSQAPSFNSTEDAYEETTYNLNVDSSNSLMHNIWNLFSPSEWWQLWELLRVIWVWVFMLFLVWWWAMFLLYSNDETQLKNAKMNILYIFYWWILFFSVTWIFWTALNLWTIQGSEDLVSDFQNDLMLQVLWFLKAAAFFVAIIMIFYYWYRIVQAFDSEDKISQARKGFLNVIIALIFIKVIDFIYYIAQQDQFVSQASSLIVSVAQILWYILWWLLLMSVFYAWFLLITSRWEEESWSKAKSIIKAVFLITIVVLLFLLIVYQVIWQVTA